MRQIDIPNSIGQRTIHNFLSRCDFLLRPDDVDIEICFPNKLVFMEPFGVAMLAAFGDDARNRNVNVRLEAESVTGLPYLKRMHVFDYLQVDYKPTIREGEGAGRFIPLIKVSNPDHLKEFIGDLMPLLHLDENSADAVGFCVSELVRNVLEHAGNSGAYVCAQFYKKHNRVSLGVADRGRGILNTLITNYPHLKTYRNAIPWSLRPGVTGASGAENAGAGLFVTKSIAKVSNSWFSLYSGDTCYRLERRSKDSHQVELFADPLSEPHQLWSDLRTWPGTVVAVDINIAELKYFRRWLEQISKVWAAERVPRPKRRIRFT